MLATSVPVDVVPSPPRWPSWNIHTIAPNAAVSESTLSTRAFSGITTLPVSRNSNPNVITAIRPSTSGSRDVIALTLSRLVCAVPPSSTARPSGPATACRRRSWASEVIGEERRRALDGEERAALRLARWRRGRSDQGRRSTNVPIGADTAETSGTRDRSAAYRAMSPSGTPSVSGMTTLTAVAESLAKSLRNWSPTWRAEADSAAPGRRESPTDHRGTARRAAPAARPRPIQRESHGA